MAANELTRLLMLSVKFARKTADNVSCKCHVRHFVSEKLADFFKFLHSIFAIHAIKYFITTRLYRHMKKLVYTWMTHDVSYRPQVLQYKRRISHAQTKHAMLWQFSNYSPQKSRQVNTNVTSISTRVLAG